MAVAGSSHSSRRIVAAFLFRRQRRFFNHMPPPASTLPSHSPLSHLNISRGVNRSAYDKNVEEEVVPSVVPNDVIQPDSDKYWATDPNTGVFGPDAKTDPAAFHAPSNSNGADDSVLVQQAFFHPHEDLDKPVQDFEKPIEP